MELPSPWMRMEAKEDKHGEVSAAFPVILDGQIHKERRRRMGTIERRLLAVGASCWEKVFFFFFYYFIICQHKLQFLFFNLGRYLLHFLIYYLQ